MKELTHQEYIDLLYALVRAIEELEKENHPRLERIKKLFDEI